MKMTTIKHCFAVVLDGDREGSRAAARRVRKLVYGRDDTSKYSDIKRQIDNAPTDYAAITEGWRQENFVLAISVIYFLHDRETEPDFLFSWLFMLLEHERGAIRYAAVRMLEHELGALTVHLRHPKAKFDRDHVTPTQADSILLSMNLSLHQLLRRYDEPKYRRYKYISELPSSPYKSVQMILSRMEEYGGEGYLERLVKRYQAGERTAATPSTQEINTTRDELELQIAQLLEAANSEWTVDDVKEAIYAERDQDNFTQLLAMFDTGEGVVELSGIIEVLSDAWNYFPHGALGGLAPVEIIQGK